MSRKGQLCLRREKHLANLFNHQMLCKLCVLLAGGKCSLANASLGEVTTEQGSNPSSLHLGLVTLDWVPKLSQPLLAPA